MTTAMEYMQWVGKNLDWFAFHTPQARQLRREIREWLYGDRDAAQAQRLREQFDRMFSGNPFQDALCPFFRREIARQFMVKGRAGQLAQLPECAITGTSIRAYGGPEEQWRQSSLFSGRLHQLAKAGAVPARNTAELLRKGALSEGQWYAGHKIRLWTLVCLLWYAFGVVSGVLLLAQLVWGVGSSHSFSGAMAAAFPATFQRWGRWSYLIPGFALAMLLVFCGRARRLGYTLAGCLFWMGDIRRENQARSAFFEKLVERIRAGGMDQMAAELSACSRQLMKKEPGFLEKEDQSPLFLGDKGVEWLAGLPLPTILPRWEKRENFYRKLQKSSIKRPGLYLAAGLVLVLLVYGAVRDPAGILPVWRFVHGA